MFRARLRLVAVVIAAVTLNIGGVAHATPNSIDCGNIKKPTPAVVVDCSKLAVAHSDSGTKINASEPQRVSVVARTCNTVRPTFQKLKGDIQALINQAAQRHGLSPALLSAVAQAESGGNPSAISSAGAIGVMQLMPGTAVALGVNPYNPEQNINGGAKYLRQQIDRFGNVPLALAAYNAGPAAVEKYNGIPPYRETKSYVSRVIALAAGKGDKEGE